MRLDRVGRFALRHPSGAILGKINAEDGEVEDQNREILDSPKRQL